MSPNYQRYTCVETAAAESSWNASSQWLPYKQQRSVNKHVQNSVQYTVSQKNDTDVAQYNFDAYETDFRQFWAEILLREYAIKW